MGVLSLLSPGFLLVLKLEGNCLFQSEWLPMMVWDGIIKILFIGPSGEVIERYHVPVESIFKGAHFGDYSHLTDLRGCIN